MPPLTKTCPKMVLSHKGGSLCVKDAFAKKFFGAGRDSAAALYSWSAILLSARPAHHEETAADHPISGHLCSRKGKCLPCLDLLRLPAFGVKRAASCLGALETMAGFRDRTSNGEIERLTLEHKSVSPRRKYKIGTHVNWFTRWRWHKCLSAIGTDMREHVHPAEDVGISC